MKRIRFSIILITQFLIAEAKANESISLNKTDTLPTAQLVTFLSQLDVQNYYGKPVDSFLLAIPANIYNQRVYWAAYSKGGDFCADRMMADFVAAKGTGPGVVIYVKEYTHMNRYSPTGVWDASLFRKEKIYKIEVWSNHNNCINGACQ